MKLNRISKAHHSVSYRKTPSIKMLSPTQKLLKLVSMKLRAGFGSNTVEEKSGIDFISNSLKKGANGIILGDGCHYFPYQHNFLSKNLGRLYGNKVRDIYLEFIRYENSPELDKFYRTGSINELALALNKIVYFPEAVLALVQKAKDKGIRCHALDVDGNLIDRNVFWANQVMNNFEKKRKFVLVGGSWHLSRMISKTGIDSILKDQGYRISTLETVIPWKIPKQPASFSKIADDYAILTYKSPSIFRRKS